MKAFMGKFTKSDDKSAVAVLHLKILVLENAFFFTNLGLFGTNV